MSLKGMGGGALLAAADGRNKSYKWTPTLIAEKAEDWTKATDLRKWFEDDYLFNHIAEGLVKEALKNWFKLIDQKTGKEVAQWRGWKKELKSRGFFDAYLKAYISARTYADGLMVPVAGRYQVIRGYSIESREMNLFDEPVSYKIMINGAAKKESASKFYCIHRDQSYLKPIQMQLMAIYWLNYAMTVGMVKNGVGFMTVYTNIPDDGLNEYIQSKLEGINNRYMAIIDGQTITEIKMMDVKISTLFHDSLKAEYEMVSTYVGEPTATMMGIQHGTVSGAGVDERSQFEVYADIQSDAEQDLRDFIEAELEIDISKYDFEWNKTFRQSDREIEEVKMLVATRRGQELSYRTINEIRDEMGLPGVEGGDELNAVRAAKSFSGESDDESDEEVVEVDNKAKQDD